MAIAVADLPAEAANLSAIGAIFSTRSVSPSTHACGSDRGSRTDCQPEAAAASTASQHLAFLQLAVAEDDVDAIRSNRRRPDSAMPSAYRTALTQRSTRSLRRKGSQAFRTLISTGEPSWQYCDKALAGSRPGRRASRKHD